MMEIRTVADSFVGWEAVDLDDAVSIVPAGSAFRISDVCAQINRAADEGVSVYTRDELVLLGAAIEHMLEETA